MFGIGLVVLLADLVFGEGLVQLVLFTFYQVQSVSFYGSVCYRVIFVMRIDDVQVVIQSYVYCVVFILEFGYAEEEEVGGYLGVRVEF